MNWNKNYLINQNTSKKITMKLKISGGFFVYITLTFLQRVVAKISTNNKRRFPL